MPHSPEDGSVVRERPANIGRLIGAAAMYIPVYLASAVMQRHDQWRALYPEPPAVPVEQTAPETEA